jgi:hypothetical protein
MINQRLQFGPFRGEQGFAVELGGQGLVLVDTASVLPTPGKPEVSSSTGIVFEPAKPVA